MTMHFPARIAHLAKKTFTLASLVILITLTTTIFHLPAGRHGLPSAAYADVTPAPIVPQYPPANLNSDVQYNQSAYVQSTLIELSAAFICQLVGINPINQAVPCLGIDAATHRIGYIPTSSIGSARKPNGLIGSLTGMISSLYVPPAHTSEYFNDLASNFGIVHSAYAASDGLQSISALLRIWKVSRDLAYFVFVIAFIFIGLGIMLRIKIDPRTVMSIQNQIPNIVISIILITFSFAIAGLMIDAMWLTTYIGINVITGVNDTTGAAVSSNPLVTDSDTGQVHPLSFMATQQLLWTPISYVNKIFSGGAGFGLQGNLRWGSGITTLTSNTSGAMGSLLGDVISQGLDVGNQSCADWTGLHFNACLGAFVGWLASIILWVIMFCAIMIALFRVWFELLKAYVMVLIYIIIAPLWIVMGLFPGKPLGFGKWLRYLVIHLAVFPATACVFVLARIFQEVFKSNPQDKFTPPLIGNPNMQNFGSLGALGLILMAPTLLAQLKDSAKVESNKYAGSITSGIQQGMSVPGAIASKQWTNMTKRNSQSGAGEGILSKGYDTLKENLTTRGARTRVLPRFIRQQLQSSVERKANQEAHHGSYSQSELENRSVARGEMQRHVAIENQTQRNEDLEIRANRTTPQAVNTTRLARLDALKDERLIRREEDRQVETGAMTEAQRDARRLQRNPQAQVAAAQAAAAAPAQQQAAAAQQPPPMQQTPPPPAGQQPQGQTTNNININTINPTDHQGWTQNGTMYRSPGGLEMGLAAARNAIFAQLQRQQNQNQTPPPPNNGTGNNNQGNNNQGNNNQP